MTVVAAVALSNDDMLVQGKYIIPAQLHHEENNSNYQPFSTWHDILNSQEKLSSHLPAALLENVFGGQRMDDFRTLRSKLFRDLKPAPSRLGYVMIKKKSDDTSMSQGSPETLGELAKRNVKKIKGGNGFESNPYFMLRALRRNPADFAGPMDSSFDLGKST